MPDITKQPYKNIIELYTKLKVMNPLKIIEDNVNVHTKNKYLEKFKDYEMRQTGGGTTKIKIENTEFDFNSYHMGDMAFYNLLTPNEQACIVIEIDKLKGVAHIESLQFSDECFAKNATEKSRSMLLRACLKLLNTVKDKYKLKYVWLMDTSEKYCNKVNNYINLDSFYMLLYGNSWYGKYGFEPFKKDREINDEIRKSKYKENQKIVKETSIENTKIEDILINAIKKNKLKFNIEKVRNTIQKHKKMTINKFFKTLMKKFDNMCELFYYSYEEIMYKCGIHDLHNGTYWLKL